MLHVSNMLPSHSSVILHSPMLNFLESRQIEKHHEVTMASPAVITLTSKFFHEKKQRRVTNKQHKKINETNKDVIEVGEFKKEWMAKTKYRDFEEHHLIDI